MKRLIPLLSLTAVLLAGTQPAWAGDKTLLGIGMGAALGGFLGSTIGKGDGQLAATGAGVFLGGLMGHSVGSSLDRADSAYYGGGYGGSAMTYAPAYPSYYEPTYVAPEPQPVYIQPQVVEYYTPQSRAVVVESDYMGPPPPKRSRHCREFTQTVRIDGQVRESYGTACLRPDGSWQIEK